MFLLRYTKFIGQNYKLTVLKLWKAKEKKCHDLRINESHHTISYKSQHIKKIQKKFNELNLYKGKTTKSKNEMKTIGEHLPNYEDVDFIIRQM